MFQFILISKDVKHDGRFKNITSIQSLMPTKAELDYKFEIGHDRFAQEFAKRLSKEENKIALLTIAKSVAETKFNLVLMCSPEENDIGYLEIIADYITSMFDIEVLTYKKIKKNPKLLTEDISNKEEVLQKISKYSSNINNSTREISDLDVDKKIKDIIMSLPDSEIGTHPIKKLLKENDFSKSDIKEMSKAKLLKKAIKLCNKDVTNVDYLLKEVEKATRKLNKK